MNAYLTAMLKASQAGFYIPEITPVYVKADDFRQARFFLNEEEQLPNLYWLTYRTDCKRGRALYDPEWDRSRPWCTFWCGTAGPQFSTLNEATLYFLVKHQAFLDI